MENKGFEITCLNCGSHKVYVQADNCGYAFIMCAACDNDKWDDI